MKFLLICILYKKNYFRTDLVGKNSKKVPENSVSVYCTNFHFLDHFIYLRNPKKMAKIETKSIAQCEVSAKKTAN